MSDQPTNPAGTRQASIMRAINSLRAVGLSPSQSVAVTKAARALPGPLEAETPRVLDIFAREARRDAAIYTKAAADLRTHGTDCGDRAA